MIEPQLSILAEEGNDMPKATPPAGPAETVRGRLRAALEILQRAEVHYWMESVELAGQEIARALATLDSLAGDCQAAPRSWLVERMEREV